MEENEEVKPNEGGSDGQSGPNILIKVLAGIAFIVLGFQLYYFILYFANNKNYLLIKPLEIPEVIQKNLPIYNAPFFLFLILATVIVWTIFIIKDVKIRIPIEDLDPPLYVGADTFFIPLFYLVIAQIFYSKFQHSSIAFYIILVSLYLYLFRKVYLFYQYKIKPVLSPEDNRWSELKKFSSSFIRYLNEKKINYLKVIIVFLFLFLSVINCYYYYLVISDSHTTIIKDIKKNKNTFKGRLWNSLLPRLDIICEEVGEKEKKLIKEEIYLEDRNLRHANFFNCQFEESAKFIGTDLSYANFTYSNFKAEVHFEKVIFLETIFSFTEFPNEKDGKKLCTFKEVKFEKEDKRVLSEMILFSDKIKNCEKD